MPLYLRRTPQEPISGEVLMDEGVSGTLLEHSLIKQ